MAASTSRTSPGNHKVLLAALLGIAAAASFLPGSSACTSLVAQTCGRTSNQRLCVSLLESSNQSRSATTVRELAIIGLKAARRSALRARLHSCNALYLDCLRAAASALARVTYMPAYDNRVADAVSSLRVFPEKCQGLFDAQGIASPLEKVNRVTEEKLGIASEIVHLLR
uniref:Pectinesterase inhibitor domain-containing protein n=1 Tax=Zea mays TaxID=4577 RepID=A0A804N0Z8_MAIZE